MKIVVKSLVVLVVSVVLGAGSAFLALNSPGVSGGVRNGAWIIDTQVGSASADIYARAWVARHALLALDKSEAIYFVAFEDDSGKALMGDCTYVVQGRLPPALWSSMTVYGDDNYLIPNDLNRWSYPLKDIAVRDGRFAVIVSPQTFDGPWLPVKQGEGFNIFLRLYQPDSGVIDDPTSFRPPSIVRQDCS